MPLLVCSQNSSPIWNKFYSFAPLILPNLRWVVSNGMVIEVLRDPWISSIPIGWWSTLVNSTSLQNLMINVLMIWMKIIGMPS